jgi:hypothetical protein
MREQGSSGTQGNQSSVLDQFTAIGGPTYMDRCNLCGAVVDSGSLALHADWHQALDERLKWIAKTARGADFASRGMRKIG